MNLEDLERLAELKKKHIITQEEFDAQKQAFLNGIGATSQNQKSGWEYYKLCWRKYVKFSGRASRSEYWYFYLFNFLIGFIIGFISGFLGFFSPYLALPFNICSWIYTIAAILPSWAVFVRRFHDIGKSAWLAFTGLFIFLGWLLLTILLFIGVLSGSIDVPDVVGAGYAIISVLLMLVVSIIWYIVFPCLPSLQGSNKYGPQP